jgi:hypothetical protein
MFSGAITIIKAGGSPSLAVNELTAHPNYPVEEFIWHTPTRGESPRNLQSGGGHFHKSYADPMPIEMQGHLLADSTSEYWTRRKALLAVIVPDIDPVYRFHSVIQMQLDGDGNVYYANVILKDYDIPLIANYPTVTAFQIQWEAPVGYWTVLSSLAIAKI